MEAIASATALIISEHQYIDKDAFQLVFHDSVKGTKLFLGSDNSRLNKELISSVDFIVEIANDEFDQYQSVPIGSAGLYRFEFIDRRTGIQLESFINRFVDILQENEGKIGLVHCAQGRSRSASLVIGWLIKVHSLSYDDALDYVKKRRAVVQPNVGFIRQLKTISSQSKGSCPPLLLPPDIVDYVSTTQIN